MDTNPNPNVEKIIITGPDDPWAPPGWKPKKGWEANVQCKSCRACRNNPKLRERYYHAWFEREPGEETLEMIGKEIGISLKAIYQHANRHMKRRVKVTPITDRVVKNAELMKAQSMKDLQVAFDHDGVLPKEDYEKAVDDVIADGMAQLKVKGKEITINQLLAAAKLKGDWNLKKRGQNTELIKTMYRSASGFTKQSPAVDSPGPD